MRPYTEETHPLSVIFAEYCDNRLSDLRPMEMQVWNLIFAQASVQHHKDYAVTMRSQHIARKLGTSIRTVQITLDRLMYLGLLTEIAPHLYRCHGKLREGVTADWRTALWPCEYCGKLMKPRSRASSYCSSRCRKQNMLESYSQ
jgi:hypothetical protein